MSAASNADIAFSFASSEYIRKMKQRKYWSVILMHVNLVARLAAVFAPMVR